MKVKSFCLNCEKPVEFNKADLGNPFTCPHCHKQITAKELKRCYYCRGLNRKATSECFYCGLPSERDEFRNCSICYRLLKKTSVDDPHVCRECQLEIKLNTYMGELCFEGLNCIHCNKKIFKPSKYDPYICQNCKTELILNNWLSDLEKERKKPKPEFTCPECKNHNVKISYNGLDGDKLLSAPFIFTKVYSQTMRKKYFKCKDCMKQWVKAL